MKYPLLEKQKGMTLIEVLAALSISSVVLLVAFGVLNLSMKSYERNVSQITLQEEANLVMTTIATIHQQSVSYTLEINNDNELILTSILKDGKKKTYSFIKNFRYELSYKIMDDNDPPTIKVLANQQPDIIQTNKPVMIDLTISDVKNPNSKIHVSSMFDRL